MICGRCDKPIRPTRTTQSTATLAPPARETRKDMHGTAILLHQRCGCTCHIGDTP